MKCPRCQHDNPQEARFCEECATPLARTCSNCGTALSATAKFCHACAHPVAAEAGAPSRSPDSYTPKHLAERIINSKTALEGERKQVTVLFADLKGSMELLADRDPEEARTLLDPVLERMMEAVHRYEGTVNQVMGDGVMALFGAPLAHEDHAVRGCYAALRMQESVKKYAEQVRRSHGIVVTIRVGLNSGEVVVRTIGSDLHMDYTAVGQTTHLAARMEQLADPGSILLTRNTLALAEGFVEVTSRAPVAVKGVPGPVVAYELVGARAVRSRLQVAAARGFSEFVGRDVEIERLCRALERARSGQGHLAAIVGEAGVGKSRLVSELIRSHHVKGWRILETGSLSYGTATSYLPVIELLKRYFLVDDHDTYRDIKEKIRGKIRTLSFGLEPALPALLALLDVPPDDVGWSTLDPHQRRQRTLDALKQLLLCEAGIQPLLVVFEDLHWVDAETEAVITALVEALPAARLLLLVEYRPDYRHDWAGKAAYTELRLDGLSRQSAETLLSALLGSDASLRPLKTLLPEKTGGNPLFLEESVRSLIETGAVRGTKGNYRLTTDIPLAQMPRTVQAIIAARIDRLTEAQKQLLQTAAVIGLQVPLSVVRTVTKESSEAVRGTLAELEASEFLYKNHSEPDVEYSFKHVVIRDVAYGSLLMTRRRAIHRAVFDAIEQQFANRLDEHVERLAYHAHAAELWREDVTYAHRAGGRAIDRSAYSDAAQFLRQALDALRHVPPSPKSMELEVDVRWDLRSALWPLGEREPALENMRLLQLAAQRLGEPMRLARVYTGFANDLTWNGRHKEALEYGSKAMALSINVDDLALQINARLQLGFAQYAAGGYQEAAALADVNIQTLSGSLKSLRSGNVNLAGVLAHTVGALARVETGRFNEAATLAAEASRLALDGGRAIDRIVASWPIGTLHVRRGDAHEVIDTLTRAWTLCNELSATRQMPWTGCLLAYARTLAGVSLEENLELFRCSLRTARMNELRVGEALFVVWQAESALLMGDPATAASAANYARALAQERGERGALAWALYTLGRVSFDLTASPIDVAIDDCCSAARLAAELGMRPLVAHCHLGLGKLYHRTDKREQARKHLATATAMYREMGMTYWLEKAEAEMTD